MCVVIDLDVVCLVCLHHSAEMHSIFSCADEDVQIAQKISTLSKLKVEANNESLPDKICDSCLKDLKAAWRFHKNCQTAVAVFQSILKPLAQSSQKKLSEKTEEAETTDQTLEALEQNIESTSGADVEKNENIDQVVVAETEHHLLAEKESNDEFMEMDHCVVEEEHEDYQSIAETGDELELVEYYIADETPHENQAEKMFNKVEAATIKEEKAQTSTIASKKLVVNTTTQPNTKVWPTSITKCTTSVQAVPRIRQRPSHSSKTTILESRKCPKIMKRPETDRQQQLPTQNKYDHIDVSQEHVMENEDECEDGFKPVKPSRKRKSSLPPDAKPPKICEICGNSYRFQHALNAHMRRHFQDKPFPCEMCDKAFVSNVELRRHMRVHTGHKPYACQYCDRRFSDFGSRIKHERTHTGERPYVCTTCGKSFAYPHVLSVHLRTHTGEKKFRCDYCTKGFTKKVYLLSHIEQHHSKALNITTYELTMDDDEGADTMDEGDSSHMKTVKFEDCMFTPEFVSDIHHGVVHQDNEEDELDDDDHDGNNTIIQQSLLRPKIENANADDDGDTDVQEVEIHLDEYTIRVR